MPFGGGGDRHSSLHTLALCLNCSLYTGRKFPMNFCARNFIGKGDILNIGFENLSGWLGISTHLLGVPEQCFLN